MHPDVIAFLKSPEDKKNHRTMLGCRCTRACRPPRKQVKSSGDPFGDRVPCKCLAESAAYTMGGLLRRGMITHHSAIIECNRKYVQCADTHAPNDALTTPTSFSRPIPTPFSPATLATPFGQKIVACAAETASTASSSAAASSAWSSSTQDGSAAGACAPSVVRVPDLCAHMPGPAVLMSATAGRRTSTAAGDVHRRVHWRAPPVRGGRASR